ncbi:hypothetical protein GCM10009539_73520 [Cryptosporangium japonicum]|uniref:Uncharacterized protein n=1 Tax=Cryptosporangium japonicum TaxID=80872 RepID=A0ABP3EUI6_9ACTN
MTLPLGPLGPLGARRRNSIAAARAHWTTSVHPPNPRHGGGEPRASSAATITAAAQALYTESRDSGPIHLLSPSAGAVVLSLWVAGLLAVGGAVLLRRDA